MHETATRSKRLPRWLSAAAERPRYSFVAVFCASLLSFVSIGAVITILPRYVTGPIGGGDLAVGMVVGAFAFSAVISRPVAGRLADSLGRRRVVLWGALAMAVAGVLYPIAGSVAGLVGARLVLGVGEGFVFTAGAAWTIDLAPPERRGQAIGLFGLSIWMGLAVGPPIGEALYALGSFGAVWAFAIVAPLLGAGVAWLLPERGARERVVAPRGARGPLIPPAVIRPGIALGLANVGYACLAGFVALHLQQTGADNGPAVFTAFAIAVVVTRLALGRLPDRLGARRSAVLAAAAEAVGLAVVALAHYPAVALLGGVLMGVGFSTLYPALSLLVVNRVDEARRGAAVGSFTAFFDIGVGIGAPVAGVVAHAAGYAAAFWVAVACAAGAAALTWSGRTPVRS